MPQFKFSRDHIDAGVPYSKGQVATFEPETIAALLASGAGEVVKPSTETKPARPRETKNREE